MKLIVSAADYGMLDCLTDGCLKAIRDGILRDVAFITNNPSAFRAAEEIKKYPFVSIGQEINFVSGWPVSDPKEIPSLVNEEGRFLQSRERQQMKAAGIPTTFDYQDALLECENQVKRFIELIGRKPSYMSGHSFGNMETRRAIANIAEKYGVILSAGDHPKLTGNGVSWYRTVPGQKAAYTVEMQLETDVEAYILEDRLELLGREYAHISTHCGYFDEELARMSSFSVIRAKELFALSSPKVLQWIKDNHIELINMDDFVRENEYENNKEKFMAPKPGWSEH